MTLDSGASIATIIGGVAVIMTLVLGIMKLWIKQVIAEQKLVRSDTAQLQHNGGSHVADYARDARDAAIKTDGKLDTLSDKLTEHLIQSASKHAEQDAQIKILAAAVAKR